MGLWPTQDPLSEGVQKWRSCAALFAEIGHRCAVVAKDENCLPDQGRQKVEETLLHSQEFASIDGESCLIRIPKAGSGQRTEASTPTHVQGVGPNVEIWGDLNERQTRKV